MKKKHIIQATKNVLKSVIAKPFDFSIVYIFLSLVLIFMAILFFLASIFLLITGSMYLSVMIIQKFNISTAFGLPICFAVMAVFLGTISGILKFIGMIKAEAKRLEADSINKTDFDESKDMTE